MKAIKKILAVLLAGALVFGFAACSSDDDDGSSGDTKVERPAASEILASFKGRIPTKGEYVLYYLKSNLAVVEIVDREIFLKGSYTGDISKDGEGTVYLKADDDINYFWELTGNDLKLYGKEAGSTDEKLISTFTRVSENPTVSDSTTTTTSKTKSSKNYPFSGTTWVEQGGSTTYTFSESTYKVEGEVSTVWGIAYSVEKEGDAYITKTGTRRESFKVDSADATTATLTYEVGTYRNGKYTTNRVETSTYIRK